MKFHIKRALINLTACLLVLMMLTTGCGAKNNAEITPEASAAAETTQQTTSRQTQTETENTEPAAPTVEIEDADIAADLAELPEYIEDELPPVAFVADRAVTQPEYRYMLNYYKSSVMLNSGFEAGADEDLQFWTRTASNGKTRLDEAREKVLVELQQLKISLAVAESRGIGIDQDELANISTSLSAEISRFGSREEFEAVLRDEYGVSIEEYLQISKAVMLRDKLYANERESISVSEDEIKEYYDQNQYMYGDQVRLRQILFLMEGVDLKTERGAEETLKLAEETLDEVRSGADMGALAAEKSEEPYASENGGEHIAVRDDPLIPEEILAWAFGAAEGDSALIELSYGYYVARLEERIFKTYEDSKSEIMEILKDQKLAERIGEWLKDPAYAIKVDMEILESIT